MLGRKGFSVFEVMVTMALILGVMTASISIFRQLSVGQNQLDMQSNFLVVRSNILSLLRSSGSWEQTVLGDLNATSFGCFKNQASLTPSDRDCPLTAQMINIYDAKGRLFYDFQKPTMGFSPEGNACDTYGESPTGTPNPQCPLRVEIRARSLCAASPCENPAVEISANFRYSSPNNLPLNFNHLNFRLVKSGFYCPTVTPAGDPVLVAQGTGVTVTSAQVTSTVSGKNFVTGSGHYDRPILPCSSTQADFRYAFGATDLNADSIPDTEGIARVCLVDYVTGACNFEFRLNPVGPTFELWYGGVTRVATKPAYMNLTSTSVLRFKVYNGRVEACFEGSCFFAFSQKIEGPFNIEYRPASSSYSAGFNSIMTLVSPIPY